MPSQCAGGCSGDFPAPERGHTLWVPQQDKLPGKAGGPGKEPVGFDTPRERCVGPRGKGCAGGRNPPCTQDQPPCSMLLTAKQPPEPRCKHQSQHSLKYRNAFISLLGWK